MVYEPATGIQAAVAGLNHYFNPPMPKRLPEDQDLFRVKDASAYFDVHEKTLREMIRRGESETDFHEKA